jgi:WD40 repeat protein
MAGSLPDADGCLVSVDGIDGQVLRDGDLHVFGVLSTGNHDVTISDVAFNCIVQGDESRSVTVHANDTTFVLFSADCPTPGSIQVATNTAGSTTDPDGYTVVLDGETTRAIGVSGTETFQHVAAGYHEVELIDVADNCGVIGENPISAAVEDAATSVQFSVACPPFYDHIAYQVDQDIFVMESDGSNPMNVTRHLERESRHHLDWSPDGTRLVFRASYSELHVMRVDGSIPVVIARHDCIHEPEWSPDGSRIAFIGGCGDEGDAVWGHDIWLVDPDGSNPVNLTNSVELEYDLTWAPDATRIAYEKDDIDESLGSWAMGLWVIGADGADPTRLKLLTGSMSSMTWSPDGTRIAYGGPSSSPQYGHADIWTMNPDGSDPVNVTNHAARTFWPDWSPDGARIVFCSDREPGGIFVINADGSNVVYLASGWGTPAWSPGE